MPPRRPEILAPAGDLESLRAALASGADAVYFGLDEGFNARARADNFSLARLPETVALIHRAGARAYITLNTLIFEPELPVLEHLLRGIASAGVDALIVQDPAVALLARRTWLLAATCAVATFGLTLGVFAAMRADPTPMMVAPFAAAGGAVLLLGLAQRFRPR